MEDIEIVDLEEVTFQENFIKTLNHPRKIKLAQDIFNKVDENTLILENTNTRVSEMKRMIEQFRENPKNTSHYLMCRTCGK